MNIHQMTPRHAISMILFLMCTGSLLAFPVTVKDSRGARITVKTAPKRIVSLAPSNTEILFALGAGDRIVGVTSADNYPPAAQKKTKIASPNVNVEKVLAQKPDLVVGVGTLQADLLARLGRLGIPVVSVDPRSVGQAMDAMMLLGKVTGHEKDAAAITGKMNARIAAVKARSAKAKTKPRVFVEIWDKPLMSAGPNTLMDEMIRLAGGQNIARDAKPGYVQFSEEAVIARNPEIIIATCNNRDDIISRPRWRATAAVKSGRVVNVNPDILVRPGPRLADGLERLEKIFHP